MMTTSMFGLKKDGHICKISPKMVNPTDIAGKAEEKELHEGFYEHCNDSLS